MRYTAKGLCVVCLVGVMLCLLAFGCESTGESMGPNNSGSKGDPNGKSTVDDTHVDTNPSTDTRPAYAFAGGPSPATDEIARAARRHRV